MEQDQSIRRQWLELSSYMNTEKYLHYSFDFWNTIAFSNQTFKEQRAEFICNFFNHKYNKELINKAFSKIGLDYNSSVENNSENLTIDQLYLKVFEYIGINENFDLEILKSSIFKLFLKYPPFISENFIHTLESIELDKISLSITSNTAFIPGFIIEKFLKQIGILNVFSFCVFSDVTRVSKPNPKIFDIVLDNLSDKTITAKNILHIGDNYEADYLGARNSGLSAFHLENISYLANSRYSLHTIKDTNAIPFSPIEYSKFKYGDTFIAEKYGKELFEYFKHYLLSKLITNHRNFILYSSPYAQIPTSSYYLTQSFYTEFCNYLVENRFSNINLIFCKIQRCQTYVEDYGALNAKERFNLIKNDTYEFVNLPLSEDFCIFIDDISITGTHQRVVEKVLDNHSLENDSIFLYYAKLENPDICPSFENFLNHSFVSDVIKLRDIILSDKYKITTRLTKHVLALEIKDLEYLIYEMNYHGKNSLLKELVDMSDANEYNKIELYKLNLKILKRCV